MEVVGTSSPPFKSPPFDFPSLSLDAEIRFGAKVSLVSFWIPIFLSYEIKDNHESVQELVKGCKSHFSDYFSFLSISFSFLLFKKDLGFSKTKGLN